MTALTPPSLHMSPREAAHVCAALPDLRAQVWQPLAGGRVNRVWRVGALVIKLHHPAAASPLFPNDAGAEYTALRLLEGTGLAPSPVAGGDNWLAYRFVEGQPWRQGAASIGRLLAQLHGQPTTALPFRRPPTGNTAILADAMTWAVRQTLPPLPQVPASAPVRLSFLHGDPVAGNIIGNDDKALLIDWQCPALGDPVDDIALFLSPGMQLLYRGSRLSADEIAAFRATYGMADVLARYDLLAPLLHWRIAAHCALRASQGHDGYAEALDHECRAVHAAQT
ncbi:aminoglycoside phosphotransferase family protein [Gemmobacter lutimaris]|uniref:Aminoglycoside phosphotransferase family protein n=2 Tax=Gemmobacter lutimaris TaxID=2306023 RepID=A0A398BM45_9RHOB|nr:aminoglycoside phosphotransferase family protein [Gemmobacter lutimaris]